MHPEALFTVVRNLNSKHLLTQLSSRLTRTMSEIDIPRFQWKEWTTGHRWFCWVIRAEARYTRGSRIFYKTTKAEVSCLLEKQQRWETNGLENKTESSTTGKLGMSKSLEQCLTVPRKTGRFGHWMNNTSSAPEESVAANIWLWQFITIIIVEIVECVP